jgi:hypothetical protein
LTKANVPWLAYKVANSPLGHADIKTTTKCARVLTSDAGGNGLLTLDATQSFSGTVAGLAQGDTIDLANFQFSGTPVIFEIQPVGRPN